MPYSYPNSFFLFPDVNHCYCVANKTRIDAHKLTQVENRMCQHAKVTFQNKKTIPYIIYKHCSYYFFSSFLIDFLYCIHTFKKHITSPKMNSSLVNDQMVIHTQLVNHSLKPLDLTHGQWYKRLSRNKIVD